MKCKEIHFLLNDYFEGSLPDEDITGVRQHLSECESCRLKLKEIELIHNVLTQDSIPQPEENFWVNFLPELRSRIEEKRKPRKILVPQTRLALGFLSILLVAIISFQLFRTDQRKLAEMKSNQNVEIAVADPNLSSSADQLADALSAESTQTSTGGVILSEEEKRNLDLTGTLLAEDYLSQKEIGSILDELSSEELKKLEENINQLKLTNIL